MTATWSPPTTTATQGPATSYNLRVSPTGAASWADANDVASPHAISGLAAGAAYDVQVRSVNATGQSPWSAIMTATTASAGPFAPNPPEIVGIAPPPDGTATRA